MYYANYLRFMERARTEWLRALGFEQDALAREEGVLFAVRSAEVRYLSPARFNDELTVIADIADIGAASIAFLQEVRRGEEILCRGRIEIVCVEAASFRPRRIPAAIRDSVRSTPVKEVQ